ncbi:MAG: 23S rRNA pseudouridine(2604) synthase RluF [Bacteroidota bacterium]
MNENTISLNKYISSTGICSRREADRWIEAGRVKLNGVLAKKGNRVGEDDLVTLDDEPLGSKPATVYLALHKPEGITCTTDRRDPTNIIDFVGHPQRIFPVGRLDKASSGLIFLTNDGDIVNEILREENYHEKEYIVQVNRPVSNNFVRSMSQGVPILGTVTQKCLVEKRSKFVFRIVLTQGLNRQIRRMCEYFNYRVVALKRVRIMNVWLDEIRPGKWRSLTKDELRELRSTIQRSKGNTSRH